MTTQKNATLSNTFIESFNLTTKLIYNTALSKNLYDTKTLTYFFLLTFKDMIRCSIYSIDNKLLISNRVLIRSVAEYYVDLLYLMFSNNIDTNKQFAKYHTITRHKLREMIEFHRSDIPRIEKEFIEQVLNDYPEFLKDEKLTIKKGHLYQPNFEKIGKRVQGIYKNGWTGYSFFDRFKIIITFLVFNEFDNELSLWNDAEKEIKENDKEWSSKSLSTKIIEIIEKIRTSKEKSIHCEFEKIDPFINLLISNFRFYSEYTHPTPRSVIPHLELTNYDFKMEWDIKDDIFNDDWKYILLLTTSIFQQIQNIELFDKDLKPYDYYMRRLSKSVKFRNWISKTFLPIKPA